MGGLLLMLLAADPFGDFLRPAVIDGAQPAAACVGCHEDQGKQWAASRHAVAFSNDHFLAGFAAEPHARCVHCHAPLATDVLRHRKALVATRSAAVVPPGSMAHEGITCVTCHLPGTEHAQRTRPGSCAACHEFKAHETRDGQTRITEAPMQTTWSEWQRWGGSQSCESCHMPGGSHAMRGAFDLPWLRASVKVEVTGNVAIVSSVGVGHRFPTGDVFRRLVLWADGVEVAQLTRDTALEPGIPVRVALPKGTKRVRLTYHCADDRSPLPRDDVVVSLFER